MEYEVKESDTIQFHFKNRYNFRKLFVFYSCQNFFFYFSSNFLVCYSPIDLGNSIVYVFSGGGTVSGFVSVEDGFCPDPGISPTLK